MMGGRDVSGLSGADSVWGIGSGVDFDPGTHIFAMRCGSFDRVVGVEARYLSAPGCISIWPSHYFVMLGPVFGEQLDRR